MSRRPAGRISSGARAAPYARPAGPNRSASGSGSRMASRDAWEEDTFSHEPEPQQAAPSPWPPATLTIRGASGPTWVIVGNLMLGTSAEDIEETFKQFGEIAEIKRREPPSPNHPSMSFNVAFSTREAALASIQSMDRVVADGRVISVSLAHGPVVSGPARLLNAAGVSRSDAPAPRVASGAAIVQPLEAAKAVQAALPKRQAQGQQQQQQAQAKTSKAAQPQGKIKAPGGGVPVPVASLSSRLLTAAELRALQKRQARDKAAAAAAAKPAAGGKGSTKGAASAPSNGKGPQAQAGSLSSRIGALPLALRLAEQKAPQSQLGVPAARGKGKAKKGPAGAAMSDVAMLDTASAKRKRSRQGKGKGAATGMDVD